MACRRDLCFLVSCGVVLAGDDVFEVLPETGAISGFKENAISREVAGGPRNVRSRIVICVGIVLQNFEGTAAAYVFTVCRR